MRAGRSTQPEPVELENALEVGEEHLDFLAQPRDTHTHTHIRRILRSHASCRAPPWIERGILPNGHGRAASVLQGPGLTVHLAGAIEQRRIIIHARAGPGQYLATRVTGNVVLAV